MSARRIPLVRRRPRTRAIPVIARRFAKRQTPDPQGTLEPGQATGRGSNLPRWSLEMLEDLGEE
ncbi:hypothetical protein JXA47_14450 [Candidatus Sumerlaeota bacterium]|nr:hypothetical protein [Candidatus Sumerlaeota bacterium]